MAMNLNDKGLRADINVTPLVDVMLVLLIIFMVITPMLQKGKPVQLPQVALPEKEGDKGTDVVLSIEYTGRAESPYNLYVTRTKVEEGLLVSKLEEELRRRPGAELYLKGDARLTYGQVRHVMELCHDVGFAQVKLATEEIKHPH